MRACILNQHHPLSLLLVWSTLFIATSFAESDDWVGCVDPENPTKKVRRLQRTTVCLGIGPGGGMDWANAGKYGRYSFKPEADKFSKFTVQKSFKGLVQDTTVMSSLTGSINVFSSSQTHVSDGLRQYYDAPAEHIYPHLTAIIDVKDGNVKKITWDKACMFCRDSLCKENTYEFDGVLRTNSDAPTKGCYLTLEQCNEIHENGGTECDLTLYTVWTGTDENGKVLTSAKFRFSAFTGNQIINKFHDGLAMINGIDFKFWE